MKLKRAEKDGLEVGDGVYDKLIYEFKAGEKGKAETIT